MAVCIVVRGPLGAGKTTVAEALARAIRAEVVSIDAILETLDWDGGSEELFLRANLEAAARVRALTDRGVPAVVDGNFYWRSVADDLEARVSVPCVIFSLQVPLEVCLERDRNRPLSYGLEATREVYEKVARVSLGTPIDGSQPLDRIVAEIRSKLPVA